MLRSNLPILVLLAAQLLGVRGAPQSGSSPSGTTGQCVLGLDGKAPAQTPTNWNWNGNVRRYYVAAEEVEWDYAPTGWDNWLGVLLNVSPRAMPFEKYGTKWLKALYRGYTDSSFTERSEQPPWQGTQGPTLRSEVNDLVEIMFVNKLNTHYATMHSMGLQYNKAHGEGAAYPNTTIPGYNVELDPSNAVPPSGVAPGNCVVYKWMVTGSNGPVGDEPARVHSYHSYVAMDADTNTGLIGPSIVYAEGKMNTTMAEYREFPLLYMIYNEAESWMSGANKAALTDGGSANGKREAQGFEGGNWGPGESGNRGPWGNREGPSSSSAMPTASVPSSSSSSSSASSASASATDGPIEDIWSGNRTVWIPQVTNLRDSNKFSDAPSYHSLNGYIFANNPVFNMCQDDKVIWYVNGYGSASHTFHMHGNEFSYRGDEKYAIGLNDGEGKTLFMTAWGVGFWELVCHVNGHFNHGMLANYQVFPKGQCPLESLATSD